MSAQKPSTARMTLTVHGVVPREPVAVRVSGPSLVVTMETSNVEAATLRERAVVDRTTFLLVPARSTLRFSSKVPGSRVAVLGIGEPLLAAVARRYAKLGLDRPRLERWLGRFEVLPRTVWVHEIVHRYVFERVALDVTANDATRFLETEILKEVYFLLRDREAGADRARAGQRYSAPVERAVAWIEAHLFEPCGMADLARRAGASESTLLRSFRRELGCRPGEYWRTRRLDEALALVRGGRYSVLEVATRVGYDNARSFAFAFRQHFGRPPSAFRPSRPVRRSP